MQIEELAPSIEDLGRRVRDAIASCKGDLGMRDVSGLTDSGDASFEVDVLAEKVVSDWLKKSPAPLAVYTEELGFLCEHKSPEYVLVVDALDGSRAFRAGLQTACVSIALARFRGKEATRFSDIALGYLWELSGDTVFAARKGRGLVVNQGGPTLRPPLRQTGRLEDMAWAFEVCARPAQELFYVIGDLINRSSVRGGCFLFNSTTFAISRIVLGWLDAFIDVGVRIVEELPGSVDGLMRAGQEQVLGLFPYDLAAVYLIAKEAGLSITDGYGQPLDARPLLGSGPQTRLSCIAAQNSLLHQEIMRYINGKFDELLHRPQV